MALERDALERLTERRRPMVQCQRRVGLGIAALVASGLLSLLALTRTRPEERMATGIPAYRGTSIVPAE